jgi:hypothetical protein
MGREKTKARAARVGKAMLGMATTRKYTIAMGG